MRIAAVLITAIAVQSVFAGGGIIDNCESEFCKVRNVDLGDVRWTDGFWAEKFELVEEVTIPKIWEYFQTAESGHWGNFQILAGEKAGDWHGTSWHDGDFYKWLEAVVHVYEVTRDPKLDALMDEIIETIAKAQADDGYLSTQIMLEKMERFSNLHHHELYNMGHLMTAGCIHRRATGKDSLLNVAIKTGDYLYETFKARGGELANFGFNPSNIMGAVELYRTTGDAKYLELAGIFVSMRGAKSAGGRKYGFGGTDLTQDRVPLREESEAVGHAVTATYLYAGAADVYMETGEAALKEALDRIWDDVARRKMYVHGGMGPLTHGLSVRRDDVHEAFGDPYVMDNRAAYCESCANIGSAMWNWRMFNITGQGRYVDMMERVLYNSGISGLGLDGESFYYTNPLRRLGPDVPLIGNANAARWKHKRSYCCPPQLARTIAKMRGYAYSVSEDAVWVNFYGSNKLDTKLADATAVHIAQRSDYPWDGQVELEFAASPGKAVALKLRVPQWAGEGKIAVNGKTMHCKVEDGYATVKRKWKAGDKVTLSLATEAKLMRGNPLIEQARNQVAVMRGPVVYCLESVDLSNGVDILDVVLSRNVKLSARFDGDTLGGVVLLEGKGKAISDERWSGRAYGAEVLYGDISGARSRDIDIRMIPYCVWSNRGPSQMTVWLPIDW